MPQYYQLRKMIQCEMETIIFFIYSDKSGLNCKLSWLGQKRQKNGHFLDAIRSIILNLNLIG